MFQNYVERSTKKVLHTLEQAVSELVSRHQNVLTPDFILVALLSQADSEARKILEKLSNDPKTLVANINSQIHLHYQNAAPVKATQIMASQEVSLTGSSTAGASISASGSTPASTAKASSA